MNNTWIVFRREFAVYFSTPMAYVFIVIFLGLSGAFTFYLGGFFERGEADLQSFFTFQPWLYLLLVPAVSMRLWAEERKVGTIELLMTLPISTTEAVLGKYFAAWAFIFLAQVLTFPLWLTVNYLGDPDNGRILASYIGSLVMAGAYPGHWLVDLRPHSKSSYRLHRRGGGLLPVPAQRRRTGPRVLPRLGA